ncbi:hypothetical protein Sango_3110400 [Sesamum angolense]|uniref:CCHC-type domain-containing protein n=1 Tax=Sesamum angolense TaxID=2727404 RepID=A0AAE1VY89_9LAMI|nr:hypothetical protein Sango_3110400 [Sesamum angolense]
MATMEEVLEGGPWLYLGQPIVLQKWEPGMVLRKLKHTEVPVWIKLRHLPVELWTTDGLSTVASGIGRPLYPDAITRACTRLDFARVCVMLNVSSKLPKHIVIMMPKEHRGELACKVDVEYEWLPPKCTNCTSLGHATKECPLTKPEKPVVSIYVRKNQIPAPVPRTGDLIPTPDPVFDHPVAKDDMVSNEWPHQRMDKGKQIAIYNAFDILRDADEDADESIRRIISSPCQTLSPNSGYTLSLYWKLGLCHQMSVGYKRVYYLDGGGLYSGPGNRIWIAWNDDFIDVDILNIGSQFVIVGFICTTCMNIFLTFYGANEVSARRELWQGLTELAMSVDLPWLVGGDFNAVLDMSEVSGASGDIRVAMHDFNDCISQTGLISLPMQGERFSWHNCSTDGRSLWKRLDRMFVNDAWLEQWPNLFYTCLTPRTSDHSPLVLKGDSRDVQVTPSNRTPMYSVTRKLKALKPVFRQQRRKKGDLAINVKLAAGFLEVAQKLLQADRHNSLLLQLENCCRLVYLKATQLEHVMLRQRTKLQWLKGGDQCSKAFFRRVATRRANKRLFQISDSDGLVQTDPNTISSVFVTYFQDLLGGDRKDRALDLHYLRPWARHILTEEEACALIRPVTVDDVKIAMFDIEEDKAPGPNGFSSGF